METIGLFLYYILVFLTVALALGTLLNKNPVRSGICLIGVMLALAVNFLIMRQEFVAFIQVIVYAGAIMVLFLFVIMLLNLREEDSTPFYLRNTRIVGGVFGISFFGIMLATLYVFLGDLGVPGVVPVEAEMRANEISQTIPLSTVMITSYVAPFVLTSVLLLVATIGAIVMARRKDEQGNEIEMDEDIA